MAKYIGHSGNVTFAGQPVQYDADNATWQSIDFTKLTMSLKQANEKMGALGIAFGATGEPQFASTDYTQLGDTVKKSVATFDAPLSEMKPLSEWVSFETISASKWDKLHTHEYAAEDSGVRFYSEAEIAELPRSRSFGRKHDQ